MANKEILIVGAGAVGLTVAKYLSAAGYPVQLVSDKKYSDTVSSVAAATFTPYFGVSGESNLEADSLEKDTELDRLRRWARITLREFLKLSENPAAGIIIRDAYDLIRPGNAAGSWHETLGSIETLDPVPTRFTGYSKAYRFQLPVIDTTIYLPWLETNLEKQGVRIQSRRFGNVEELEKYSRDYAIVINCTGIGSRELMGDSSLSPIKGHVISVENPGITDVLLDISGDPDDLTYIIPRVNDAILGSTFLTEQDATKTDTDYFEAIRERCFRLEPSLADSRELERKIGERPGRTTVCMAWEAEARRIDCYGHGGGGISLSIGCALQIAQAIEQIQAGNDPSFDSSLP